jgi:Zn-dependent protease
VNLIAGVGNLVPLPFTDGGRILGSLKPKPAPEEPGPPDS